MELRIVFIQVVSCLAFVAVGCGTATEEAGMSTLQELRNQAEAGDAHAQRELATLCRDGNSAQYDPCEAARWFRQAAEGGDARAQVGLADLYERGLGVPEDRAEALRWYRLAADQGYAPALYALGVMYREGRGVEREPVQAYKWLRLAESLSLNTDAAEYIDREKGLAGAEMASAEVAQAQVLAQAWLCEFTKRRGAR